MRIASTHHHAAARGGAEPVVSQPGMDFDGVAGAYFPNSRVASNANGDSFVSPLSYNGSGPGGDPLDVLMVPRGGESPWIIIPQSEEQGLGRSPGQQWPWQSLTEAYNFEQLFIMPFEWDQTGPVAIAGGWSDSTDLRTPPERVGWPGQPGARPYYENYQGYATNPDSVAVLNDPQQAAYTIAWGGIDGGDYSDPLYDGST